jgi:hypothetical protein
MTEAEQQLLKSENVRLLQQKADADAEWHKELRDTLKAHTAGILAIEHNTSDLPLLRAEQKEHDKRIKRLEDLATKMIGGVSVAIFIIAAAWKLIDKLWK